MDTHGAAEDLHKGVIAWNQDDFLPGKWDWDAGSGSGDRFLADCTPRLQHHKALQYIHDFVPSKLCGHACTDRTEWVLTCCRCNGILPSHRTSSAAARTASKQLQASLEPFQESLERQQHVYCFLADSYEHESSDENEEGVGDQDTGWPAAPSRLCWVCQTEDNQPDEYLALSSIVSSHWPPDDFESSEVAAGQYSDSRCAAESWPAQDMRSTPRTAEYDLRAEEEASEAHGLGAWAVKVPDGGERELRCVWDSVWEKSLSIAAQNRGPWWLLRVIHENSAALPPYVRACGAHDSVWYAVCQREGLVGARGTPRPPFQRLLTRPPRAQDALYQNPVCPAPVVDGQERARERERHTQERTGNSGSVRAGQPASLDTQGCAPTTGWLAVYLASKRSAAAVNCVADKMRNFGGPCMHFNPGLSEQEVAMCEDELGCQVCCGM